MKLYKLRNKETGLFIGQTRYSSDQKMGRSFKSLTDIKLHIKQRFHWSKRRMPDNFEESAKEYLDKYEIVEYTLVENNVLGYDSLYE